MGRSHPDGPNRQWLLRAALLACALLALLIAGSVLIAEHHLKATLVHAFTAHFGRPIRVDGALEAHLLSRHPKISATRVVISNPPWMPAGVTAELGHVSLTLDWQLATPPFGIRRLEIENAALHLLRDAAGGANWTMSEEGAGPGPPLIRSLSMPDARVELHDEKRHLQFSGTVSARDAGEATASPPLRIEGAGQLNGRAASFWVSADPLAGARRAQPYHFTLEERSGSARLSGHGLLERPFDFRILRGSFEASGPDMRDVYFLVGLKLPETGPFHLSGKLEREQMRFVYSDLTATTGKSDMSGTVSVDSSSSPAKIEAELSSEKLSLADIGARDADHAPAQPPRAALLFSDTPFQLPALRRADSVVKFHAHDFQIGAESLHTVSAVVSIDRGVLSIQHLQASLAEGAVSASARLDATRTVPRAELDVAVTDVHLEQLKRKGDDAPVLTGLLSARAQLSGEGKSLHELAASANGTVSAVIPLGAMRASMAELARLNLSGALGMRLKADEETGIRCGVASFDAHDGLFSIHSFVIDTDKALLTASGAVHMDTETLDFALHRRPKKLGLTLHSAIEIHGTLAQPKVSLLKRDVLAQTGAAVGLGILLTPLAAVLAFVNPGLAHDADCVAVIAQAVTPGPASQASPHDK